MNLGDYLNKGAKEIFAAIREKKDKVRDFVADTIKPQVKPVLQHVADYAYSAATNKNSFSPMVSAIAQKSTKPLTDAFGNIGGFQDFRVAMDQNQTPEARKTALNKSTSSVLGFVGSIGGTGDLKAKFVPIYRYNDPARKPMGESKFYGESRDSVEDFNWPGTKLEKALVDKSKLYDGGSSYGFLIDNKYDFNTKEPIIRKMTNGKAETIAQLDELSALGEFPNEIYSATQQIAARELRKLGFGGARWVSEDDLIPVQYQIWDKSILK